MLCLMFIPMGRIRETKRKRRVAGKNRRAGVKRTLVGFVGFRILHRVDVLERLIVVVMLIRYQYQALLITAPSLSWIFYPFPALGSPVLCDNSSNKHPVVAPVIPT